MVRCLNGKTAVVTGAARGIGQAIAAALAGEGANVVVNHRAGEDPAETLELVHIRGGRAIPAAADVFSRAGAHSVMQQAVTTFGSLDVAVLNAGIYPRRAFLDLTDDEWGQVLNANLTGTFVCCQEAARIMVARGTGGRIITLSSGVAAKGAPLGAHYAASKAGIIAVTKSVARELGPFGVLANCIAPGTVDTAMARQVLSDDDVARRGSQLPAGRIGTPDDVAACALFLAAQATNFFTGQVLYVNGGDLMP